MEPLNESFKLKYTHVTNCRPRISDLTRFEEQWIFNGDILGVFRMITNDRYNFKNVFQKK